MTTSRKEITTVVLQFIISLVAFLLFTPLSLIIPKNPRRIVVIGRESKFFLDNTKHFFLFLCKLPESESIPVFLTMDKKTLHFLSDANLPAVYYPSWRGFVYLLTANFVVVDGADWIQQGKYHLTFASKTIQLWHGAPLKQIEYPLFKKLLQELSWPVRLFLRVQKKITGRYAENEYVISTSTYFTNKAFKEAFNTRHIINTGYPRNDALLQQHDKYFSTPIWLNTDISTIRSIHQRKLLQKKIILYSPTYRKGLNSPFSGSTLNLHRLDDYAGKNHLIFVTKLHPLMENQFTSNQYKNILCYDAICDIYPALSLFDVLITDYSSIYFDYLLLNRPIIFFPYDYESYIENDKELLFEYRQMTPGPICKSQGELEKALLEVATDHFAKKRKEISKLVFDYHDCNASIRLWEILKHLHK